MLEYRIYCLDDEGKFSKIEEMKAANDAEALAYARALNHDSICEVWSGTRLVGKIGRRSVA
jgi:hypothetical protein